jgi:hypothetical protein
MSRTAKLILRERARERGELAPEGPRPFSPDHKVYPQGWSWAMIERETERRYRSERDVVRLYDWTWAVDEDAVRKRLSKEAVRAAHELYDHQQRAVGDYDRLENPRVAVDGGFEYLGASWAQTRSEAIASAAKRYVLAHAEATPFRLAVFEYLFRESQPTLEEIRGRARPDGARLNAKGRPIRISHRETVDRIVWCCEALADCEAGLNAGYGPSI